MSAVALSPQALLLGLPYTLLILLLSQIKSFRRLKAEESLISSILNSYARARNISSGSRIYIAHDQAGDGVVDSAILCTQLISSSSLCSSGLANHGATAYSGA